MKLVNYQLISLTPVLFDRLNKLLKDKDFELKNSKLFDFERINQQEETHHHEHSEQDFANIYIKKTGKTYRFWHKNLDVILSIDLQHIEDEVKFKIGKYFKSLKDLDIEDFSTSLYELLIYSLKLKKEIFNFALETLSPLWTIKFTAEEVNFDYLTEIALHKLRNLYKQCENAKFRDYLEYLFEKIDLGESYTLIELPTGWTSSNEIVQIKNYSTDYGYEIMPANWFQLEIVN